MELLTTERVSKTFRDGRAEVRAVDGVSLCVERGSLTALAGRSGSGKTTLLSLLGAADRPSDGRVLFDERDFAKCSDTELARLRRRMGFVFQEFALIRGLSVADNIVYPLIPRGVARSRRDKSARELLARLGIEYCRDKRPEQLSGGERQRVAIARALVGQPEIFLADEPTSNLDAETAGQVAALIREIHQAGTTVILATHDPVLLAAATSVYHLQQGRLVDDEPRSASNSLTNE